MAKWINRTELTGSSINPNGTTSHTCTFTAATAGNFLMAIVAGSVTSTTPSGWTLFNSAINYSGLYVFTKTATSGESSFSTTHNGSNYPIKGIVYEFPAGTSTLTTASNNTASISNPITGPTVSSLTGTYTRFAVRSNSMPNGGSTASLTWTLPATEDLDAYIPRSGSIDGIHLSIAYDDSQTAGSFTPNYDITGTSLPTTGEAIAFALNVAPKATPIAAYSFDATGSIGGTLPVGGTIIDNSGNGNTLTVQDGGTSLISGTTNVGVQADGTTYAEYANASAIKPTTAVTIMCWVKLTSTGYGWGQIFGRNNDEGSQWGEAFSLYLDANNGLNLGVLFHTNIDNTSSSNELTATLPSLNTWAHLTGTWSSADGVARIYINGTQANSAAVTGSQFYYGTGGNTSRYFTIFRNTLFNERASYTQIDDVRVFDKQLSSTEITAWMNIPVSNGITLPLNWVAGVNS